MNRYGIMILLAASGLAGLGCGDDAGSSAPPSDGGMAGTGGEDGSMGRSGGGDGGPVDGGSLLDGGRDSGADGSVAATAELGGVGQKGPFEAGSSVQAFALAADGSRTDDSITGSTSDDGSYDLAQAPWSGPTEVEIQGTFYDEVAGSFSTAPRTLTAVVAASGATTANVNLFSHFAAARIKTLMSEGEPYATAQETTQQDMESVFGIMHEAQTLDILEAGGDTNDDNASLLAFSAALIREGLEQTAIDAIAADFADDGRINGDGESHFDAVVQRAADEGAQLVADAKSNLEAEYGGTTPSGAGSIGWVLSGCVGRSFFEPNVLCDDHARDDSILPDETNHYVLYPDIPGSFAWLVDFDDSCTGSTIGIYSSWDAQEETGSGEVGSGSATATGSFMEGFTTLALQRDDAYHVTVRSGCDAEQTYSIRLFRVSEGSASDPVVLRLDEPHEGTAGHYLGPNGYNYTSYYRVIGRPDVVQVYGYRTADAMNDTEDGVYLQAYAGPEDDPQAAFDSTPIATSQESGAPLQEVTPTLEAGSGDVLYLTTENENDVNAFQDSALPTREDYTIEAKSSVD